MAEIGSLAVSLTMDASNFNGTIAQVDRSLRAMGGELQAIKAKGVDYGKSVEGLSQRQDILKRSLDAAGLKLQEQRKRYDDMVASGDKSEAAIQRQAIAVNRAQAEYNRLDSELKDVTNQLKTQSSQWTQAGQKMQEVGGKLKSIGDGMTNVGKKLTKGITAPLTAVGVGAFKMAVDFESAFAGVKKTVDTSEEGFKKLEQGIRDMAKQLPASASDIAAVAESAGQLGIAEDKILSFSRTIIDLGESTNLTREQAAKEFARFANIVGMNQDNFDRLGSSIVGLGNSMATTESEIMSMGMRLAAQGAQVGMSEAQIMALAGTMSSLGIQAEMGGTAMTKILKKIQGAVGKGGKDLEVFAKAAGMTGVEFKNAFETDAISALDAFVKGLAKSSESGENLSTILTDLGFKGVYESDVLLRMAGASDLLSSAVDTSTNAWRENTALSDEASKRYETTASQMAMLKNQLVDVGISIGNILIPVARDALGVISPWVEKFGNLSEETQKTIVVIGGLAAAIGPLIVIGGTLISSIGTIVSGVGGFSMAIGAAGGATTAFGAAVALVTGPVGLAVGGIAALGTVVYAVVRELSKSAIEVESWKGKVSEATAESVGSFMDLNKGATDALTQLKWSGGTLTTEMANDLIEKNDQMTTQVLETMKSRHEQQLTEQTSYFDQSSALSAAREQEILEHTKQKHVAQEQAVSEGQARINEIYKTASNEKRAVTKEEFEEIDLINAKLKDNAIQYLSESERDQKVIYETLKRNASEISAQQAADVVKNSKDQRDKTIKDAEDTYTQRVAAITKMRDEDKTITKEEADAMIAEAERGKNDTIKNAKLMHQNVVSEAKAQAGEHVEQVNWETGEVLSKWEVFKNNASKKWGEIKTKASKTWNEIKTDTVTIWEDIKSWPGKKIEEMKTAVEKKMGEVKTKIETKWNEAQSFLENIKLFDVGKDIVQGLINGIGSMLGAIGDKAKELGQKVIDGVSNVLQRRSPSRVMIAIGKDVGRGLAIGIDSTKDLNEAVMKELGQLLIDVTKENQAAVSEIADKAEKERTEIQKDAAAKKAAIEKKLASDIHTIESKAAAKKRKLTTEENNRIAKLREAANDKLLKIEQDNQKKFEKINTKAWTDMVKKEESASGERLKIIKQFVDDKKSANELSFATEAHILEQSLKLFKDGTAEKIEIQKMNKKVTEEIDKEAESIKKTYVDNVKKLNDEYIAQEQKITKEYEDEFNKRRNLYYSFAGLFDEVVQKDVSGSALITALQSQITAFEDWQKNITELASKGIDEGLLAELREMGPKAGAEIAALNTLTDEQLQRYVTLWKQKNEQARTQAEAELTGLKQNTEKSINELRLKTANQLRVYQNEWRNSMIALKGNVKNEMSEMPNIGEFAVSGLIDGMLSKQNELISVAQSLANIVSGTFATALQIHSPSRIMRGYGVNVGEGLILGINDMVGKVAGATKRLAKAVTDGSYNSVPGNSTSSTTNNTENHYSLTVNSPKPLDPYETARLSRNGWKEMALQI